MVNYGYMKKPTGYSPAPLDVAEAIENAVVLADFLPVPNELVLKEDTVRVTLNLSKSSVEFFKKKASKHGVPYQNMIRQIIDLLLSIFRSKHE